MTRKTFWRHGMSVAELIAELQTKNPDSLVVIDVENQGWWSLDTIKGLQDISVKRRGPDFVELVEEGASGAIEAVRIW